MSQSPEPTPWSAGLTHVTLVTDDLAASRDFYRDVLMLELVFEDTESAVFSLGTLLINTLVSTAAPELMEPLPVSPASAGTRTLLTLTVDDVDAAAELLTARGVTLLNGQIDRPWGIRTAAFTDPGGHAWELAGPTMSGESAR